jgi:hypothetical protein
MRGLSISRAWDESRDILARDGRLFVSIALCLVALPTLIMGLLNPKGMGDTGAPLWISVVSLIASLVALGGQLALIRLALAPSITVADAIDHGMRRMPIYLLSAIIIVVFLVLMAFPFAFILAAMGVPIAREETMTVPITPPVIVAVLLYLAIFCFVGVRMLMSAPAVTAERIGPIAALKRSWVLTGGHWWMLFGFLVLFFIAAMIILVGIGAALGAIVGLSLGPVQPMSASALVLALVHSVLNAALTTLLAVMMARIYVQLAGRADAEAGVPNTGI